MILSIYLIVKWFDIIYYLIYAICPLLSILNLPVSMIMCVYDVNMGECQKLFCVFFSSSSSSVTFTLMSLYTTTEAILQILQVLVTHWALKKRIELCTKRNYSKQNTKILRFNYTLR